LDKAILVRRASDAAIAWTFAVRNRRRAMCVGSLRDCKYAESK
jgi:hypothetical protein